MTARKQRQKHSALGPNDVDMQDFGFHIEAVRGQIESASLADELEQCRQLILADIHDNFERSQTPDGQAWPPRKDDLTHPLLQLSLALFNAATDQGPGSIQQNNGRSLNMGIDLAVIPYARAQDMGFAPNNLPARNYYGAREATLERCRRILMRGMKKKAWPSAYDH